MRRTDLFRAVGKAIDGKSDIPTCPLAASPTKLEVMMIPSEKG